MRRDAISPPGKRTGLYDRAIPVLRGAAWHPGAAPEEVHFKLLQMGAAAALLIFLKKVLCVWVFRLHICLCVCVPQAHSLQSQKVLHTSCRFPDTLNRDSGKSPVPTSLFAIPQCLTNTTSHYCQLWSVVLGVQWRRTLPPDPRAVPQPGNSDGHESNRTESAREEEDAQSIKSSPTKA